MIDINNFYTDGVFNKVITNVNDYIFGIENRRPLANIDKRISNIISILYDDLDVINNRYKIIDIEMACGDYNNDMKIIIIDSTTENDKTDEELKFFNYILDGINTLVILVPMLVSVQLLHQIYREVFKYILAKTNTINLYPYDKLKIAGPDILTLISIVNYNIDRENKNILYQLMYSAMRSFNKNIKAIDVTKNTDRFIEYIESIEEDTIYSDLFDNLEILKYLIMSKKEKNKATD